MVLEVEETTQREKAHLTKPLLALVGINGGTKIISTKFNKNHVKANIRLEYGDVAMKPKVDDKTGLYFKFQAPNKLGENTRVEFDLRKEYDSMDFVFTMPEFHSTVNGIFGTKRTAIVGSHKETLESIGLESPETLKIDLEYKTPMAVWRGLPKELLRNISYFAFDGRELSLEWPQNNHYNDSLGVKNSNTFSSSNIPNNFKDKLIRTGIVEHEVTEKSSPHSNKEEKWVVNPEKIRDYDALQVLEEIVREQTSFTNWRGEYSVIKLSGEVDRDVFRDVPKLFDHLYGLPDCKVKGRVIGGNIIVALSEGDRQTQVTYIDATIEDTERFMSLPIWPIEVAMISKNKSKQKTEPYFLIRADKK